MIKKSLSQNFLIDHNIAKKIADLITNYSNYNLIEVGKNGTKTTLTVNSFKTNEALSKSLFTFDSSKYTDYYINKLD